MFGNLDTAEVIKAEDYALAEAASPIFGAAGFTIMALAALVSTSSAINASLYSATYVTDQRAKTGASLGLVLLAVAVNFGAIVLSAIYLSGKQPSIFIWIIGAFVLASLI